MLNRLLPIAALLAASLASELPANLALTPSTIGLRGPVNLGILTENSPRPYYLYETTAAQLRDFMLRLPAFREDSDDEEERKDNEADPLVYAGENGDADSVAIIDLRPISEYNEGHIIGAHSFPMVDTTNEHLKIEKIMAQGTWESGPTIFRTNQYVKNAKYVVFYCNAGSQRSPTISRAYYKWRQAVLQGYPADGDRQPPFRRDQEVVLLGGGIKTLIQDEANWGIVTPRPYKVIKPVKVDNAINHPSSLLGIKKSPSKGEILEEDDHLNWKMLNEHPNKFEGTRGDLDPELLSQETSRSDITFPHSLTDLTEGFDNINRLNTPVRGSHRNLDSDRRHTAGDNSDRRGTLGEIQDEDEDSSSPEKKKVARRFRA